MYGPENIISTVGVHRGSSLSPLFLSADLEHLLQAGNRGYGPGRAAFSMTFVLSMVFYGVSAFALIHACLSRFDIEVDRPPRDPSDASGIASSEGIVFEEEIQDQPEEDGIRFVDQHGDEQELQQGPRDGSPGLTRILTPSTSACLPRSPEESLKFFSTAADSRN